MEFARPDFFNRQPSAAYPVAAALVAAATGVTLLLWLVVDRPVSAPFYLAAIVLSTLCGGFRVGLFASILGAFALDYFFIQPYYTLSFARDDIFRFMFFVSEGSLLSWITEKLRAATAELKRSREELRELTRHQQTLREEEQKRIAREIHDELGQTLTGLKLDIHLMRKKAEGGSTEIHAGLEELSSRIDSTIGTVRRIASEIRPSILDDFGLVPAIEWLAADFERKAGVDCVFASNADSVALEPEAEAAIFRIAQEALTNVARHSNATTVNVNVTASDSEFELDIKDNGRGFDPGILPKKRSLGIIGMRERARLMGATLEIRKRMQGGTALELVVPANGDRSPSAAFV